MKKSNTTKRKPPRGAASPTSAMRIAAHVKQMQALELRLGGASFRQIAESLGYTNSGGAWKAINQALRKTLQEPCKKLRRIERERLNRLWLAAYPLAQGGDIKAILACVRISKRRCEFEGLDKEKRIRVKGKVEGQMKVQGPPFKVYGFNPADVLPPMPAESQGPPAGS